MHTPLEKSFCKELIFICVDKPEDVVGNRED